MTQQRVSPVVITSLLPATVTMTVQGALGQSANLQEWKTSTGTVVASVRVDGSVLGRYFSGAGTPYFDASTAENLILFTGSTTRIGLQIRGAASQTADLQQWQTSAGTVIGKFDYLGAFTANDAINGKLVRVNSANDTMGQLSVKTDATTRIGIVTRGASGQTANLQEWQNNSAGILSSVDSSGTFIGSNGFRTPNGSFYQGIRNTGSATVNIMGFASGTDRIDFGGGTSAGDIFIFNTSGGGTRFRINSSGQVLGDAASAPSFGGGVGVVNILNATTVPTTNPTGGGVLYVEAGALKYRGSSGTVTTIANA